MNFSLFKQAVSRQFANMSQFPLYAVDIEGDVLWDTYLRAFPEGTNPIYRERTEHDCTCCRQFIKNAGKIMAIIERKQEESLSAASIDDLQQMLASL